MCEKPLEGFYKHARMADGHLNKCKACTKSDVAMHRQANLEHIRQYDRMRAIQPHRIALRERVFLEWKQKHPERRAAQTVLGNAVRAGRIIPWPVCEMPDCNQKPEAHHPHYESPLLVTWLCRAHHMQAHAISEKEAA
jgi:hypothetical protein